MDKIGNRRTHWLGFVRHNFVNFYKPYMCDASSWSHASRNGDLKVYMGKGVIKSFRKSRLTLKPSREVLELFASYDVTSADLQNANNWRSHEWLNTTAARMWVRRSIESEKHLGTHLFLALASVTDFKQILHGYKKEVRL
jgi:hypothetical protein